MSRSYEYSYALEAARRQAIYNARVSATTEKFLNQYLEQYNRMNSKGYTAYIPSEMNRLKSDLNHIRDLLVTNPTEARNLSFEVGSYIRSLSSLANVAIEQFDRSERIRFQKIQEEREEYKSELMQLYFQLIKDISNPIVVNYSISELQQLRKEIESGKIKNKDSIKEKVSNIKKIAESKAEEWKNKTIIANKKNDIEIKLTEAEARLKDEKIENQEKTIEFIEKIKSLRANISNKNIDLSDVEKQITQIETEVDDTLITEEVRRETVKAIIKQLKGQEFRVERPKIVQIDGKNYVKIVAQRPSGKRAICNVDLHGKIAYKFDNYEGMTCLKDIEKFNVDLEQIYSVKLSDERILWSNPDKLSMDAESIPKNNGRNV